MATHPTSAPQPDQVTGIVLCGGQSRRWGGVDKGLVMVGAVLRTLQPQVGAVVISANRNLHGYEQYGWPVVTDAAPGFAGPLAGIAAALPLVATPWVCWCPCDVPDAPLDWVGTLGAEVAKHAGHDAASAWLDGQHEPLFTLARTQWARHPVAGAAAWLARGERSVTAWVRSGRYCAAQWSGPAARQAFHNYNDPDDRLQT
jgi:molybdopterin-guanine dinucleotide biosynthesis protein A